MRSNFPDDRANTFSAELLNADTLLTVKPSLRSENGTVTAEFVVALPALLLVVAILIAALQLQFTTTELSAVTGQAARAYLVSGTKAAKEIVHRKFATATIGFSTTKAEHCITVTITTEVLALLPNTQHQRVCLYG